MNYHKKVPYYILSALGILLVGYGIAEAFGLDFSFGSLARSVRSKSGYSELWFMIGGGVGMIGWSYFQLKMLEPGSDGEQHEHDDRKTD